MAIRQQTEGLAEIAESLNIMKRNLRGLLLFTGRVPASFSFYMDSDKPDLHPDAPTADRGSP